MASITLQGNAIHTSGNLANNGDKAPDFKLTANDLSTKTLADFSGKKIILNIFPSLDTGTCAASVRNFNKEAANLNNTVVLCISRDLPFAQARFCGVEGIENVVTLSDFRTGEFGKKYGLEIIDGPITGLLSRVILVINEDQKVIYTEQVSEISTEPNYTAALNSIK
jgi:thiol peroxidase